MTGGLPVLAMALLLLGDYGKIIIYFFYTLLAKQKTSESPAGATERHRNQANGALVRSKTNSGAGVFGVGAQIPRAFGSPFGCCASLRSEIVI
jgi:hypothetical protein